MPILMAVFGGMGNLYGPIIGAVVFAYLERFIRNEFPDYFMIGFGIILVVVILFLPNGIVGLVPILRGKLGGVISKLRKGKGTEQHANT
jgi:ABC-type branched-subunit amino acid transport system permease subunit